MTPTFGQPTIYLVKHAKYSNLGKARTLLDLHRVGSYVTLSKFTALSWVTSDHSPLKLETRELKLFKLFRCEKVWLTRNNFSTLLPRWWNEISSKSTSVLTFVAKLRHIRKRIKEWCASNFFSILNSKKAISEEIFKLDLLEER